MPLSTAELGQLAATTLDLYTRGVAFARNITAKPLMDDMWANRKSFPGGKELISMPYKEHAGGNFGGIDSASDDLDFVGYTNDRRVAFPYFEMYAGYRITRKELSNNGIKVGTKNLKGATRATQAELVQLANVLDSTTTDFGQTWTEGVNALIWGDGSDDPLGMYGIRTFIVDTPATGTVGGLNSATVTSWRNIAHIGVNVGADLADQGLIVLVEETITDLNTASVGRPVNLKGYVDRLTLKRLRGEIRAKNQPGETVLTSRTDRGSASSVVISGVEFVHDPSMDVPGRGLAQRIYIVDHSSIYLMFRDGEDKLVHQPDSPYNKLAFFQGLLTVGNMVCDRRNTSAVIEWEVA